MDGDTVHIPTDMETPLSMRVVETDDGDIEVTHGLNTYTINMLAIIQQRLGLAARLLPAASTPTQLSHSTDMYFNKDHAYPYLMFRMVPWLNQDAEGLKVYTEEVYARCTGSTRHELLLLSRLVGYGVRLDSLTRLYEILQTGTSAQCERLILHIAAAHDLCDDDMLRWAEWAETHPLCDILFHRRDPEEAPQEMMCGVASAPETKTQPPPPSEYILFRGHMTAVHAFARVVRKRVEEVLSTLKIDSIRHGDWEIAAPTLHIYFKQQIFGFTIVCMEPRYDDEVTLTRVWKELRRITL